MKPSFSRRITVAFALLLTGFGLLVALLGRQVAVEHEHETLQRLSHGLARHIVEHWPAVSRPPGDESDRAALDEVLHMLMVVNPGIEVYVLDAEGRVRSHAGDANAVRLPQVDLAPVRGFLAGAPLPLHGTDPKGSSAGKLFSAAMFPPRPGDARPPGYLYVVLDGEQRTLVAGHVGVQRAWRTALLLAIVALLATLLLGGLVFGKLTRPLRELAGRMRRFDLSGRGQAGIEPEARGDEIAAIGESFDAMAQRIERQMREQAEQQAAHREVIANVAHDLRSPLTALHGHLEALGRQAPPLAGDERQRHVATALAQSDKVRRLSQQLFELATLQSDGHVLQVERFRLDELVTDAVQKFELSAPQPPVLLEGPSPGRIELDGDLQLIERALTNLIDNALRHAPGSEPVRVRLQRDETRVSVLVEDRGPGLPDELARRLDAGRPVRDPPLQRPGGGFGGLGLAIAQRIAWLHGGSLRTLPMAQGGTLLCLALPAERSAGRLEAPLR
ncbi:sensor histidine kinase [Piscinibacter sp.]|uniref:sensor histidine kinase n=1 Tax=Piscinibacter sp. TaxID=1903157 RepID=UPI002D1D4127|nr:HAMP domain-containing sensor histidine kinase [Albitalea sp.]HUG25661.1 HAMP domain-containing sensor histidine kinase [Albitalea sp.]